MTAMKAEMTLDGFTPMFDELTKKHGVMTSAVFGTIWRYCQMERKCCDAALDTIGKRMGVNKRTIIRHLEILVKDGYLTDATPDLKHRPHTYIDAERVGFKGSLQGVTKSHPTEALDKEGVTESHTRGDRKSPLGVTESHLKKQIEDTIEETKKEEAPPALQSAPTDPIDQELVILDLYKKNITPLPCSIEVDHIVSDTVDLSVAGYNALDVFRYAITQAVGANARKLNYIQAIVKDIRDSKMTLAAYIQQRQAKTKRNGGSNGKATHKTHRPDINLAGQFEH